MIDIIKLKEAIAQRSSIRTFDGRPLSSEDEVKVKKYITNPNNLIGPRGSKINVHYLTPSIDSFKAVGTYGVIKNAPAYVALTCEKSDDQMIDCGYVGEMLVLFLTSIGIGSCWLGGTFKRQQLSLSTELKDSEFIPILIPIGYENIKKTFTDKAIRRIAKSHSRDSFENLFFDNEYGNPLKHSKYYEAYEMVRLAPSASNKQPWRIVETDDSIDFYLNRTPNYGGERLGYDIQMIDMGIAISHFLIWYSVNEKPLVNVDASELAKMMTNHRDDNKNKTNNGQICYVLSFAKTV